MKNKINLLAITLTFLFIWGCAYAKKPYWLEKEHKKYGSKRYITGIGIGETRETAENEARANIAKVFNAKVESETQDFMQTIKKFEKKKVKAKSFEDVQQLTKISTDKVLEGTIIAELKKHKKIYYAFAVLDKMKTTNILSDKIANLDIEIKKLATEADKSENKITKIKNYNKILKNFVERKAINAELKIVSPVGMGIDSAIKAADISAKLDKLLTSGFKLSIKIDGNYVEQITSYVKEALTSLGFTLSDKIDEADVTIDGKVVIEPTEHPDKSWQWVKYETSFDLVDVKTKNTFGNITKNGQEAQLTLDAANNKALVTINKVIEKEMTDEIKKYIFGT